MEDLIFTYKFVIVVCIYTFRKENGITIKSYDVLQIPVYCVSDLLFLCLFYSKYIMSEQ